MSQRRRTDRSRRREREFVSWVDPDLVEPSERKSIERLERIRIPSRVDEIVVPPTIRSWIHEARVRIEAFQDRWEMRPIEQFVAADYELVYQSLVWTLANERLIGKRFLEWGCGFAVVTALAATLEFDAVGIESEPALLAQGKRMLGEWQVTAELIQGNFLPAAADQFASDPTLPSLGHGPSQAYEQLGLEVDDFALIYGYPWPGEDDFFEAVFTKYAAPGALLMMFCGPNDVRLMRKI